VGAGDAGEGRVAEQVVAALGERSPRLDLDTAFGHEVLVGLTLEERVCLDLVDRRHYPLSRRALNAHRAAAISVSEPAGAYPGPWRRTHRQSPAAVPSRPAGFRHRRPDEVLEGPAVVHHR
jgi:hypothetical protein